MLSTVLSSKTPWGQFSSGIASFRTSLIHTSKAIRYLYAAFSVSGVAPRLRAGMAAAKLTPAADVTLRNLRRFISIVDIPPRTRFGLFADRFDSCYSASFNNLDQDFHSGISATCECIFHGLVFGPFQLSFPSQWSPVASETCFSNASRIPQEPSESAGSPPKKQKGAKGWSRTEDGVCEVVCDIMTFSGNFRFQLYLCAKSYASAPLATSSNRHGLFWVASRLALPVLLTCLASLRPQNRPCYQDLSLRRLLKC